MTNKKAPGTGVTTQQMKLLPHGGVFVVHSTSFVPYAESIKRKINRPDIIIVSVGQIVGGWAIGRIYPALSVDHYAMETMHPEDIDSVLMAMRLSRLDDATIPKNSNA